MQEKFSRHNQITEAHGTEYPVVPRPRDIEFVSRFGDTVVSSLRWDVGPSQGDVEYPTLPLPPKPKEGASDKELDVYKKARRSLAKETGWTDLVTDPEFKSELIRVFESGICEDNPGIRAAFEKFNVPESRKEECLEHIRGKFSVFIPLYVHEELNLNAAQYGNVGDPHKTLHISTGYNQAGEYVYWMQDEGEGYNPNLVPDPTIEENIDRDSGRGTFMAAGFLLQLPSAPQELKENAEALDDIDSSPTDGEVEPLYLEHVIYGKPPIEWPTEITENNFGIMRVFDAGRGVEVRVGWEKIIKDFVTSLSSREP